MGVLLYLPTFFGISIEVYFILFAIGIPVFFLLRKLINGKAKKNRKYLAILMTIILSPLIYVLIVILYFSIVSYYPSKEFNRNDWRINGEKRYELTKDLIESEILIGKSKKEVVELLGIGNNFFERNKWEYYLDFAPKTINIDPDYLVIEFKNGKVVRVRQYSA